MIYIEKINYTMITPMTILLSVYDQVYSQHNGVYGVDHGWFGGQYSYNELKSSKCNEIIFQAIHVNTSNSDLNINMTYPWYRVNPVPNGIISIKGNKNFPVDLLSFYAGNFYLLTFKTY